MARLDELQELFELQDETQSVEFKAWLDLNEKRDKATLAKSAIALANHGGGTILMGMGGKPPVSTERPTTIARYTADAVNSAVNQYSDPKLGCEVYHLPHPQTGHEHAFIIVPGGQIVPVMSTKAYPDTINQHRCYIRKPGPMSEEPFTSQEWRELLDRCVRNNRELMLDSIRSIVYGFEQPPNGQPQPSDEGGGATIRERSGTGTRKAGPGFAEFTQTARARWESLVKPLPKDDVARMALGGYEVSFSLNGVTPVASLADLAKLMDKAHEVKHTGWAQFVYFTRQPIAPYAIDNTLEAWVGTPGERSRSGRHVDFWRATRDGHLFLKRSLDEDFHSKYKPGTVFSLTTPVWRIGEAALFAARLAQAWGGCTSITCQGRYWGLKGRKLTVIDEDRMPMSYDRVSHADEVAIGFEATVEQINDNTAELMAQTLAPVYEAFELFQPSMQMLVQELAKLKSGRF